MPPMLGCIVTHKQTISLEVAKRPNLFNSGSFSRKIRGVKGLNLPINLEETLVLDKYLGILLITRVFH